MATKPSDLVADGRLTGWLLDSASARQLGLEPTGHSSRGIGGSPGASATNVDLLPGSFSVQELIGDISHGVYVMELIGQGVNPVTGDYSRGASGFIIANGEIAGPVAEITIAGNLIAMFRGMTAASDLAQRRAVNVPTLRIEGMTVAGA
jgi:PmbA protein